jgi:hypothetical protein
MVAMAMFFSGGCTLTLDLSGVAAGGMLSNVNGWDLSACSGGGFLTCAELFSDNQQLILDGRTTGEVVVQGVMGFLSTLDRTEVGIGVRRTD